MMVRTCHGGAVVSDWCLCNTGLGQHRLMPPGDYAQEKALKQEEKLIGQLERLELTNDLIKVLRDQVLWLLDGE